MSDYHHFLIIINEIFKNKMDFHELVKAFKILTLTLAKKEFFAIIFISSVCEGSKALFNENIEISIYSYVQQIIIFYS